MSRRSELPWKSIKDLCSPGFWLSAIIPPDNSAGSFERTRSLDSG
jgi:hypothetical protein